MLLWTYIPIFAGVALYAVMTGRYNLLLYSPIFVLYAVGLLAKPMLVTLPCVCLFLDYWPLRRLKLSGKADSPPRRPPVERPAGSRRKAKRNQRLARGGERRRRSDRGTRTLAEANRCSVGREDPAVGPFRHLRGHYPLCPGPRRLDGFHRGIVLRLSHREFLAVVHDLHHPDVLAGQDDPCSTSWTWTTSTTLYGRRGRRAPVDHRPGDLGGASTGGVTWRWAGSGTSGTLVPVIGIVQVGEQTHADRYTYIPYIGLFIMLAWGIADLIGLLPQVRKTFRFATGFAMMLVLATCVGWTKYQLQFWTGVEVHLRHALTITPDNWNMLNNLRRLSLEAGPEADAKAAKAEADGELEAARPSTEGPRAERRRHGAVDPRHHGASHGDRHPQQPGLRLFGGRDAGGSRGQAERREDPRQGRVAFDRGPSN